MSKLKEFDIGWAPGNWKRGDELIVDSVGRMGVGTIRRACDLQFNLKDAHKSIVVTYNCTLDDSDRVRAWLDWWRKQ